MIYISVLTDIGPVSITTDPKKFQQDLQELFVQVGAYMKSLFYRSGINVFIHTNPSESELM